MPAFSLVRTLNGPPPVYAAPAATRETSAIVPPPVRSAPVEEGARLVPLDVLRGVAVLGILYMNIQSYSMAEPAYGNPTAYGDLSGANFAVWLFGHLFFRGKFIAIFSMLYGAGIVLLWDRLRASHRPARRIHFMRNFVLLAFGLLHAYLLWYGDILYHYALAGIILFPLRRLRTRWLASIGVLFLAGMLTVEAVRRAETLPPSYLDDDYTRWYQQYEDRDIEHENDAFRGTWIEQWPRRSNYSQRMQTNGFIFMTFWWTGGFMLIGMALYKSGYFSACLNPRVYLTWIGAALFVGLPITVAEVWHNFQRGWHSPFIEAFGSMGVDIGSVFMSIGIAGAVMLWCQFRILTGRAMPRTDRALTGLTLYDRFSAAGRMAFTNYLTQTILCTSIFYGHGLGLFGYVDRTGQLFIVLAVWVLQLIWSPLWLRYFRFGPFEWLWRTLTYFRPQPVFRRATTTSLAAGVP